MKLLCRFLSATSLSILLATPAVAQPPTDFKLSSPDIAPGGKIDNKFVLNAFGCTGENVSPALVWKNAPAGTRSFALEAYDPDAPSGSVGGTGRSTTLPQPLHNCREVPATIRPACLSAPTPA
jgi:hypothetical protein